MTNEELDALVQELLGKQVCTGFEQTEPYTIDCVYGPDPVCQHAAATITTLRECEARLRAQLAEAQKAERQTYKDCVDANTRADRAEAALAAQIEADAALCDDSMKALQVIDAANGEILVAHALCLRIRNQPRDRTALDRMLAEAREKALREAVRSLRRRKAVYLLKARKAMRSAGEVQDPDLQSHQWEKCDQMMHTADAYDYAIAAIIALIEKEKTE